MRLRFFYTESFRLAAIYAAIFAVSVAVLGALVLSITDAAMRDQIVQYSQADIAAMRDGYVHEGMHEAREVALQLMSAVGTADFVLLQRDGGKLAGNLPALAPVAGLHEIPNPYAKGQRILGVGLEFAPGLYAFAGSDLSYVQAVRRRILGILLWLFGAALLMAAGGGLAVGRSFLGRMDAIAHTCRAIMAGDMKERITVRGSHDELDRLALTINEMLGRIAMLMENLRQVTGDIAHDLRTPLTHLRHRLERARSQAHTAEQYAAELDGAIAASDEILAIFAALLRIAQIEGGARRAGFAAVDLPALLRKSREVYGAVAEDSGHILTVADAAPCPVRGDQELLFQLLANLVENAIVHTPAGTRVTVGLEVGDATAVITVQDDGPGVPAAEHARLFQRFYRREASRSKPGHGLGLSLAAAVAELHGGAVTIDTAQHGMTVRVTLPRA